MRHRVARPLPGCRVPGRAQEGDTSVRQAEGKRARTALTRGREGAAATEGREQLLHPGQERASSIGGAGPHRAPGPCALAPKNPGDPAATRVCPQGWPRPGAARGLASEEDGLDACHPRALTCARCSAASVRSASAKRPLRFAPLARS
ncbi:hypothetical protein STEG23_005088 [Scotinomys teguina]